MVQLVALLSLALTSSNFFASALKIASALSVLEHLPEQIAIKDYYKGNATIINGGVASIVNDTSIDLASNAETQALVQYSKHKNLRIIYTVAEVYYRIVANKRTIKSITDLRGKRIGSIPSTSAGYFTSKYLASVGLNESEYTVVSGGVCLREPCARTSFPELFKNGSIDAVAIWEPSAELAVEALGANNTIVFQNRTVYREIFNLHTTKEKLDDPVARKEIVQFIRALHEAVKVFRTKPETIWSRIAPIVNTTVPILQAVWPDHSWTGPLPADLLDVLVEEDKWVAKVQKREPMPRSELTNLIDGSILKEALQL